MKKAIKDIEFWVGIKDFPGYLVSNQGRVLSTKGKHPIILKPIPNKKGYLKVGLCKDGEQKIKCVHNLVANAFLPPRPSEDHEVDHIDFNTTNNRVSNLQWLTGAENREKSMPNFLAAHEKKVICLATGEIFPSASKASIALGFCRHAVAISISRKRRCGGSYWKYVEDEE